jgi:hypothetical protein
MTNLAGQTGSEPHIKRLRGKLEAWMKAQGDKGVETELKARERQGRGRNKKNPKKK